MSEHQARGAGFPYFEATAQRELATVLLRRDPQSTDAKRLLDQVEAAAARHGFALETQAVAALRAQGPTVS